MESREGIAYWRDALWIVSGRRGGRKLTRHHTLVGCPALCCERVKLCGRGCGFQQAPGEDPITRVDDTPIKITKAITGPIGVNHVDQRVGELLIRIPASTGVETGGRERARFKLVAGEGHPRTSRFMFPSGDERKPSLVSVSH